MKFLKYTREIIITVLLITVALLFFFRSCGGREAIDKYKALQAENKKLIDKVNQDSVTRAEERKAFVKEKLETEGKRELAVIEKTEADKKVQQQQKTIDRLAGIVRNELVLRGSFNDTAAIHYSVVSTAYKAACDSLPAEIDKLNFALADKDSAIKEWSEILAYEVQIRDQEIYREMNYSDSLKADFNRQTVLLKSALKLAKPRGRFLAGAGIIGNQAQPLSGASIKFAYLTKGGKMYQVSPQILQGELYYEGSVLITLFK
jgi:hypothetical protein